MTIKELKALIKFMEKINPDAQVLFEDGRDGTSELIKLEANPVNTFGKAFDLVFYRKN